jgi:hypothetical protein
MSKAKAAMMTIRRTMIQLRGFFMIPQLRGTHSGMSGRPGGRFLHALRQEHEDGETKGNHQDDGHPIGEVPSDKVFGHG